MKPINDISELLRMEAIPHEIEQSLEWGGNSVVRLYYPSKSKTLIELRYGSYTYGGGSDMIEIEFGPVTINGVHYEREKHCISKEAAHKLITLLYTELK